MGPLTAEPSDGESEMVIDGEALPLSRGQLDIWLSQESGFAGTEWQLGLLGRIAGAVDHDLLQQAIRQAMFEAEPARAAFFEIDGQVFQKVTDYSDLELPFFDVSDSDDPVQTVRETASSIQRTPMPLTGRLIKFALFRTRPDEYYLFGLCHHISLDGLGIALVSRRIATIYSARDRGAGQPCLLRHVAGSGRVRDSGIKHPPTSATTRPTGARTCRPTADSTSVRSPRPAGMMPIRRPPRSRSIRPSSATSRISPRICASVGIRS